MFSTKRNIQQLTSLMKSEGIVDVVVCPGSRNAPLVHNFNAAGMECYEITDERSAGFFALGLIEAKERPVAVCCTSGSAVLNLAPAVAEAFYHPFPLLVITADRPTRWIGQMDGQTMPQQNAFGDTIRKVVCLPETSWNDDSKINDEEVWHCNRLINEAFITMKKYGGPVQINVPITEPMFDFSAETLPDERHISYNKPDISVLGTHSITEMSEEFLNAKRPMIVVGQLSPREAKLLSPYINKLVADGVVVISEYLSNLHINGIAPYNFDSIVYALNQSAYLAPDFVITLGGHIVSKRIKQLLRNNPPQIHWHVSVNGELADLFCCATRLVEASNLSVLKFLSENRVNAINEYLSYWMNKSVDVRNFFAAYDKWGFTDVKVVKSVLSKLDLKWSLQVSNSSMVRHLQLVDLGEYDVYCNRGINGIEGCVSTAVGCMAGGKSTILLTGDLAFFYDRNGLWNRFVDDKSRQNAAKLRIVVLNNGCGQIFYGLEALKSSPYLSCYIAGAHNTLAEYTAKEHGMEYFKATDSEALKQCLDAFINSENKLSLLEVFTDSKEDAKATEEYYHELRNYILNGNN